MPRFTDDWVMNKILFECTTNASCICCVSTYSSFLPDGVNSLISSVSDLESDAAEFERKSNSLFTPELKEAIWGDRVRVRFRMKQEMSKYNTFYRDCLKSDTHQLKQFLLDIGVFELKKLFQISKKLILDIFSQRYGINPIYNTVIRTVIEQLANFSLTKYDSDSKSRVEEDFELMLKFNEMVGFHLDLKKYNKEDEYRHGIRIDSNVLDVFVKVVCEWMVGPKLLSKGPSEFTSSNMVQDVYDQKCIERYHKLGNRFRSDRRLIRLMIAKYWADCIIEKYHEFHSI